MRPFTIDTNWLEGGGWKNLTKHSVELGLIKLMSTGWRKCEMVKIYGNAEKLKTNKIQAITGDKCLKFLYFQCVFQRLSKYVPQKLSSNINLTLSVSTRTNFLYFLWSFVWHRWSQNFPLWEEHYYEKLTSATGMGFMKSWQKLKKEERMINLTKKLVDVDCGRRLWTVPFTELMSDSA